MRDPNSTAGRASPPDPAQGPVGKPAPEQIAAVLQLLSILLAYGRHLAQTLERRANRSGFGSIAQFFGTASRTMILAHLHRGIFRAVALERALWARAARGRDLVALRPPAPASIRARTAKQPASEPPDAAPSPPTGRTARRPRRDEPLSSTSMIRLVSIEQEVRCRPIGSSIADILRDLGVSPCLCAGPFWYSVSLALHFYRGNIATFMRDMRRRERRFAQELDRTPGAQWPQQSREAIGKILGFFVGETPRDPADATPAEPAVAARGMDRWPPAGSLAAAAATGPP